MNLQNLTNSKRNKRLPQIFLKELRGETQTQIAEDLGVSRMTLWEDRQDPMYLDLIMEFYDEYKDKLRAFVEEGSDSFAMEALKELGRMYRAGTTRRVESKSLSVEARVDLGAGRVLAGELLGGLSDGARAEVEALLLEKKE